MILLVVLLLLSVSIFCYIKKTTSYWKQRNITGPKPSLFFGNIKESVLRQKNIATIYQKIYNDFPDEKVVGIYTMMSPALLIRDLEIAKQVLVKDFNCFSERGIFISKKKLGDNLFHCDSNMWRVLRTKLTPYFSSGKIKSSFNIVSECGDRLVEYIEKVCQNKPEQELNYIFRKYGIAATLGGMFFLKVDTYNDDNNYFLRDLDKSIFTKSYLSEMSMLFSDFMLKTNTSIFGETVVKFCNNIVACAEGQRNDYLLEKKSIVDMFLDLKDTEASTGTSNKSEVFKVTNLLIASQVFVIFATGYENTGLSLSYALNHLSKNIDIQDRLIEEIDTKLMKHNKLLTCDALNEMKYLDQVFNETLRINPFANTLQRVAMNKYTIPGTNIIIEKGVTVLISPLAIHHDEKYYKDPLKFDPERFNSENQTNTNSCAFLSFGLGPRSCLGYRFTKLLFKVAMVKILTKFIVRPSEKVRIEEFDPHRTTLAMKGGIHINILRRKKSR